MKQAREPFQFMAASTLTRICGLQALTIAELLDGVRKASTASIFHHAFQTLGEHHFLTRGFSNDFAQWVLTACNAPGLAERLAAVDIRDYDSVENLRADFARILEEFVAAHPERSTAPGFEAFHFLETKTIHLPTGPAAHNLGEFCKALRQISVHSLHFHFVTARLRGPRTNDFSHWLDTALEMPELAHRIEKIDIYTHTLGGVREQILKECRNSQER